MGGAEEKSLAQSRRARVPEGLSIGQKLNSSCFKVGRISRHHFYKNGGRVQLSDLTPAFLSDLTPAFPVARGH